MSAILHVLHLPHKIIKMMHLWLCVKVKNVKVYTYIHHALIQTFVSLFFNLFLVRHNLVCWTVINKILPEIVVHMKMMFWYSVYMTDINTFLYLHSIKIKIWNSFISTAHISAGKPSKVFTFGFQFQRMIQICTLLHGPDISALTMTKKNTKGLLWYDRS